MSNNNSNGQNYILYMHAGSGNHGCEAIANTLSRMLTRDNPENQINLVTYRKYEDDRYTLPSLCNLIQERSFDEHKLAHVLYYGYRLVTKDRDSFMRFRYKEALNIPAKTAISIGGDNYCYDTMLNDLFMANSVFNAKGFKTVLTGCSVEPELLNREDIRNDLTKYHTIIARESITYEALKAAFSVKNDTKIYLVPDPAFTLKPAEVTLPDGFIPGNTVGINLSPIAQESESKGGITMNAYKELIKYIAENTDMAICLIPHVIWPGNDDRTATDELYDYAVQSGYGKKVIKLEDADCETLKGYISKLRFFIGARTHSTIAAYSTCVPTLVVGYSVKARGIAKDLFGNDTTLGTASGSAGENDAFDLNKLVLQVQKLNNTDELKNAFIWLKDHEYSVKKRLNDIMPQYIERAYEAAEIIERV